MVEQGRGEASTTDAPARLPGVRPGTPLSRWRRWLITVARTVYFGRVRVVGPGLPAGPPGPCLVLASHRNGAIDGFQVLAARPRAQFLVSVQLLRNPLLRVLFTGIPVVRRRDVERYGLDPSTVTDPVEAGCAHLRAGGDLAIFPEGTSEWGHGPQPYHRGAARILCRLLDQGVAPVVLPLGLHYSTPDAFRSRAEVYVGASVHVPPREGRGDEEWEEAVAQALGRALDAVSVDCPDEQAFLGAQAAALDRARRGESYAEAFLAEQARQVATAGPHRPATGPSGQTAYPVDATRSGRPAPTDAVRVLGLALLWLFWPVLLVGHLAGTRADARNTVSFFRIVAGLAAAAAWLPVLLVTAFVVPAVVGAGLACAALGWGLIGLARWRP